MKKLMHEIITNAPPSVIGPLRSSHRQGTHALIILSLHKNVCDSHKQNLYLHVI